MRMYKNQKGDTIIEVLLAMALLALVLFTAWSITNRASQISLAARQRVVMVNQLKEQAELIKAFSQTDHDQLTVSSWDFSGAPSENPCSDIDLSKKDEDGAIKQGNGRFITSKDGNLALEVGTKEVEEDLTQRVWFQRKLGGQTGEYYDFYVRACWRVTGGSQKFDNTQFIVRINK